jgi:methionyl-tRNA formyltransferase
LIELQAVLAQTPAARLVAFGSGVIVPPRILAALTGPAYNFHAGPPEVRGLFPSVFALYDGAVNFGVTCHEMSDTVDSGPIVAVDRFAVPKNADREALDRLTYQSLLGLAEKLGAALRDTSTPLPHAEEKWSGPIRTRADFNTLCELPANLDAAEFQKRYRAIGEGPHHALSIKLFGHRFKLDNRRDAPVVRGGKEIT